MPRSLFIPSALLVSALVGCQDEPPAAQTAPRSDAPAATPPQPVLKRLTRSQYTNSIADVFGDGLVLPNLEPDESNEGLLSVGSAVTSLSGWGVEQYESAAFDVAEQVMRAPERRDVLVTCAPADPNAGDKDCAETVLEALGLRVWRRPMSADELDRVAALATTAADQLQSFDEGLEFGVAALLQSPNFLYRVELGEVDPETDGLRRYTDWEMASRLSYLLWDTTPDAELLEAAAAGELVSDAGLDAQVERMLADERARLGISAFFSQLFRLYALEDVKKDTRHFPHWSQETAQSARRETLMLIDALVFEEDADYRTLFTAQRTFVDRRLAALYDVRAPVETGFGEVDLESADGRRGLLGHASILAQFAHPVSSSATKRGEFIREVLFCQTIPSPPADVDPLLPEGDAQAPTLRDRVAVHLQDPSCAGCHNLTDPIGLGLENFDGIGRWRLQENNTTIDASGELDGERFADAWALTDRIANYPQLGACFTEKMYMHAAGSLADAGQEDILTWHTEGFQDNNWSVLFLLKDLCMSPAFRLAGPIEGGAQ